MSRSIFYGFAAWVGQVHGETDVSWWGVDPPTINFDVSKLIRTNLAKNPKERRAKRIPPQDVEVDDPRTDGGPTRLGPTFPTGTMIGAVWLDKARYDQLPNGKKPPRVPQPPECRDYELTTVVYYDDAPAPLTNRRFWGVHAKVAQVNGNYALLQIWPPGKSLVAGQPPFGAFWLDLSVEVLPPDTELGTTIGVGSAVGAEGAVYLDSGSYSTMSGGNGTKLPKNTGGAVIPSKHTRK